MTLINIVGFHHGHTARLSEYLWDAGLPNYLDMTPYSAADLTLVAYAGGLEPRMFDDGNPPVVAWCMGSDVLPSPSPRIHALLEKCDGLIYSQHKGKKAVGLPGDVWNIPVHPDFFSYYAGLGKPPSRDTLIYCPSAKYGLEQAWDYVTNHPDEKITMLGTAITQLVQSVPDNLQCIGYATNMSHLISNHRALRFWIQPDSAPDHPPHNVIGCEALALGRQVFVNDHEYKTIPRYMFREEAMPRLLQILRQHLPCS